MKNIESVSIGHDINWLKETNSNQNDATNLTIRIVDHKTERRFNSGHRLYILV